MRSLKTSNLFLQTLSQHTCAARFLQPGAQGRPRSRSPHVAQFQFAPIARSADVRRSKMRYSTTEQHQEQPKEPHMMHQPTSERSSSTLGHLGQGQPGRNGQWPIGMRRYRRRKGMGGPSQEAPITCTALARFRAMIASWFGELASWLEAGRREDEKRAATS